MSESEQSKVEEFFNAPLADETEREDDALLSDVQAKADIARIEAEQDALKRVAVVNEHLDSIDLPAEPGQGVDPNIFTNTQDVGAARIVADNVGKSQADPLPANAAAIQSPDQAAVAANPANPSNEGDHQVEVTERDQILVSEVPDLLSKSGVDPLSAPSVELLTREPDSDPGVAGPNSVELTQLHENPELQVDDAALGDLDTVDESTLSFPQAQKLGLQFDKPSKPGGEVASGFVAETNIEASGQHEVASDGSTEDKVTSGPGEVPDEGGEDDDSADAGEQGETVAPEGALSTEEIRDEAEAITAAHPDHSAEAAEAIYDPPEEPKETDATYEPGDIDNAQLVGEDTKPPLTSALGKDEDELAPGQKPEDVQQ